jgi:hypothetical protein
MKPHTRALSAGSWVRLVLAMVTVSCLAVFAACVPTPANVVRGNNNDILYLTQIDPILNNTNLTQEQKRQQLLDLGMPANVADALLRAS